MAGWGENSVGRYGCSRFWRPSPSGRVLIEAQIQCQVQLLKQSGGRNLRMLRPSSSFSSYLHVPAPRPLYTAQRANISMDFISALPKVGELASIIGKQRTSSPQKQEWISIVIVNAEGKECSQKAKKEFEIERRLCYSINLLKLRDSK